MGGGEGVASIIARPAYDHSPIRTKRSIVPADYFDLEHKDACIYIRMCRIEYDVDF